MIDHDRRQFLAAATSGLSALALAPLIGASPVAPLSRAVSVGVIGLGRQGRAIIGELQKLEGVTIASVCDADESRLSLGARRAPDAKALAAHSAILDDGSVQSVIIATPTHLHRQIALDAIAAGKHVYCEAPLASTIDDCKAIAKAAMSSRTIFHVGMQGRSNPIYKLALSFVRSGAIRDANTVSASEMVRMRGQHHRKTSWRNPASDASREKIVNWQLDPEMSIGLAGEFGTHQFDVFHWYMNKYPRSVRGGGGILLHDDGRSVFDTVRCTLDFGDGVVLDYDASLANSYEGTHELMHGTNGTVKLTWTHGWLFKEADAPTQGWEVYANRQQFHNEEGITLIAEATKLAAQGKLKEGVGLPFDSLHYSLSDFFKCVDTGATPPCTADEGLRAAVVGICANKAITTATEVMIDEAMFEY